MIGLRIIKHYLSLTLHFNKLEYTRSLYLYTLLRLLYICQQETVKSAILRNNYFSFFFPFYFHSVFLFAQEDRITSDVF